MTWRDRRLCAVSQAGLVEKFVDALVWVIFPVFLVSTRRQPDRDRLDRRHLRLCLGRIATVHRTAVGPCRAVLAERAGHVDLRRGVAMVVLGDGRAVVVGLGRRRGLWHGAALPEPVGRRRRHHAARLARLGHRHLPLLA